MALVSDHAIRYLLEAVLAPSPMFLTYVLLGPCACLLLRFSMIVGRRRMVRLLKAKDTLPANPPHVTVLIPAKDEGEHIRTCIESILTQDYPGFTIVAINDRSDDNTGDILDELAGKHPGKVRAVHVPKDGLPEGWLGKCHALHVGAQHADALDGISGMGVSPMSGKHGRDAHVTEWLMLIDSDVRLLQVNALTRVVALSVNREYDALSILTRLECDTFFEKLVLPLAAGAWSIMHTISMTNDDNRPEVAYANGQFFLIRRSVYESVGGHEVVRACITEDVELMRLLKHRSHKARFLLGNDLASTRMHASFRQMLKGWGRIYSGTARRKPWRILGAIVFLLVCGFTLYPALAWGVWESISTKQPSQWLVAAVVHFIALTLVLTHLYAESGNPRRNAIFFPWSGATLLALLVFALKWCITGKIEWRGTTFDQNVTQATMNPMGSEKRA